MTMTTHMAPSSAPGMPHRTAPIFPTWCSLPHRPATSEGATVNTPHPRTQRNEHLRQRHRTIIARTKPPCAICGKPIDYTLHWPDPWCYVVDHIKPIHHGGTDTLNNKQPAHNHCNSKKRARKHAPIIKRSGSLK
ncbi:HNH endonuclease [Microbacterium sp. YY-01]|uniref:HNH endonuclease n=1 Tax=Microbacterium sp. YY-01 TaxID=3421634 RepID=UPI003D17AFE0